MNAKGTPVVSGGRKRELTSPIFDGDSKKNKCASVSSISDLDLSTENLIMSSHLESGKSMASDTIQTEMVTATSESTTDSTLTRPTGSSPYIIIPQTEMVKISDMLKETFRAEIVSLVDSVVSGVLRGLQDKTTSLELQMRF